MALKLYKSAGVRVTRRVHEQISAGNAARGRGDMSAAIASYRAALAGDSSLGHIWVQLGHMLKDSGSDEEAVIAYGRAIDGGGRDRADAIVHIGHLEKDRGHTAQAARHFLQASQLDPAAIAPLQGLAELLARARGRGDVALGDLWQSLAGLSAVRPTRAPPSPAAANASLLVFDCTFLMSWLVDAAQARAAVRRQCDLIDSAHADAPDRVRLAHVHPETGHWIELASDEYRQIRTALSRDDQSIAGIANQVLLASALQPTFEFAKGSWIVGSGPVARGSDQLLAHVAARNGSGVRYAAIVDDLQPLALPQFSSEDQRADMIVWLLSLFRNADLVLAGSREIAEDLARLASEAGVDAADRIATVRLSAPSLSVADGSPAGAAAGVLYAVVVGDISGAKGHLVALDAWMALGRQYPEDLPDLVLLGEAESSESAPIAQRVRSVPLLSRKVRFAGVMSGEALASLYDGAALVICPALYEGSDAILADARARRANIVASDLPVFREHDGDTLFVPPGDAVALAGAIERRLFNEAGHRLVEPERGGAPAGGFSTVVAELDRNADASPPPVLQQAVPGRWHPFTPIFAREMGPALGSGADFRSDNGWLAPSAVGCWTRPGGGEIRIGLSREGRWRLSLRLAGLPAKGTRWTLYMEGRDTLSGSLEAGARTWVIVDDLEAPTGYARLFLEGRTYDVVDVADGIGGYRKKTASLGVVGFHLCRQNDLAAREQFLETLALSDLSMLSAYA